MVRAADLVTLPGVKKAPKKRIAAILEPSDDGLVDGGSTLAEGEEENSSDSDELGKLLYLMQVLGFQWYDLCIIENWYYSFAGFKDLSEFRRILVGCFSWGLLIVQTSNW